MGANYTEIQICNKALLRLAANTIESEDNTVAGITSSTLEAKLCKANFDLMRDIVLEDRVWSFALGRALLDVPLAGPPVFGFGKQFEVPIDALNIWRVTRDGKNYEERLFEDAWRLEGAYILTDLDAVYVEYVKRLDSDSIVLASAQFIDALSLRLAIEFCMPLTENDTMKERLIAEYQNTLVNASAVDGSQATREKFRSRSFHRVR